MDPLYNSFPFSDGNENGVNEDEGEQRTHESAASLDDNEKAATPTYNSSKPKWWKRLSNRKATKSQRRAMREMDAYRFQRHAEVPHGKRLTDWDEIFGPLQDSTERRRVWIELGCGRGENVLALAHRYRSDPCLSIIGAEIHQSGLGNIFVRLQQAQQRHAYWTGYTTFGQIAYDKFQNVHPHEEENPALNRGEWSSETHSDPYRNVRIFRGDCMKLITLHLPEDLVSRILVTFPDPFPHESGETLRLFQRDTVREFHRVLEPNEGFLCLATDHQGFFEWSLRIMSHSIDDIGSWKRQEKVDRMKWLPAISSYEEKGWREGRRTFLAVWKATAP